MVDTATAEVASSDATKPPAHGQPFHYSICRIGIFAGAAPKKRFELRNGD